MNSHHSNAKAIGTVNPSPLTEEQLAPKPYPNMKEWADECYDNGFNYGLMQGQYNLIRIINENPAISLTSLIVAFDEAQKASKKL